MAYSPEPRPSVVCMDGFEMSVQAGKHHYSTPREWESHITDYEVPSNAEGAFADVGDIGYSAVEVGFPSEQEPLLMPYVEVEDGRWDTVYPYTPVDVVYDVIIKHGGLKSSRDSLPPLRGIHVMSDDKSDWPSMFGNEEDEGDQMRMARMTVQENNYKDMVKRNLKLDPFHPYPDVPEQFYDDRLLFPGMELTDEFIWKRDAKIKATFFDSICMINYPAGMGWMLLEALFPTLSK